METLIFWLVFSLLLLFSALAAARLLLGLLLRWMSPPPLIMELGQVSGQESTASESGGVT